MPKRVDIEEFIKAKEKVDNNRNAVKEYHAFQHYRANRKLLPVRVIEWDKKIERERGNSMFKLRKQYSKNYQVVELEVSGDMEEYDTLADWLDNKIGVEMKAIPDELLQKDNKGTYNKSTKTTKQYTNNRSEYTKPRSSGGKKIARGQDFGSEKQWKIINDERNLELFEENGYDLEESPKDYAELQDMIKLTFDN